MQIKKNIFLTSALIIYFLLFLLFFFLDAESIVSYTITYILTSAGFLFICFLIFKNEIPIKYIFALTAISIILKITFIPVQPTGSDDYYRYLWDGKVFANGINPYEYSPISPELSEFHSDTLPALINFPEMKTVYPPLAQTIFFVSHIIGGDSFITLKLLLLLFEILTIYGLYLILRKKNIPLKFILIYALAPLPLFQFFVDLHVDGFGLPLLIFSLYFFIDNKKVVSLILLGLSLCIKPTGIILIPIYFFYEKDLRNRILVVIVPLLVFIMSYIPFLFTANPFEGLIKYTANWTFNGSIFKISYFFIQNNQDARIVCGIIYALVLLLVSTSKKDFMEKIYLSFFLLFIFSPVVHPWYLGWLAVLLPLIPRWSGIIFTSIISITFISVVNYQLYGKWEESTAVLLLEYIAVILIFLFELFRNKMKAYFP